MFKTSLAAWAVVLLIVLAAVAVAQTPPAPPMVVDKVTSDLHVIRGEGGNITVYVTDEGVVPSSGADRAGGHLGSAHR